MMMQSLAHCAMGAACDPSRMAFSMPQNQAMMQFNQRQQDQVAGLLSFGGNRQQVSVPALTNNQCLAAMQLQQQYATLMATLLMGQKMSPLNMGTLGLQPFQQPKNQLQNMPCVISPAPELFKFNSMNSAPTSASSSASETFRGDRDLESTTCAGRKRTIHENDDSDQGIHEGHPHPLLANLQGANRAASAENQSHQKQIKKAKITPKKEEHDSGHDSLDECSSSEENQGSSKRGTTVRWSEEEHVKFLQGLERYGVGQWRDISKHSVPSRTPSQVASHYQKFAIRSVLPAQRRQKPSILDMTTPTVHRLILERIDQ